VEDPIQRCFEASYRRLVGQMYGVCGDLAEAEEVVAEAFARAVSRRRKFERLDNPEAWLRTVAVNVARTRLRRRAIGDALGRSSAREPTHPATLSDDRISLIAALRALPVAQREALALHYLADMPVVEVAATVGAPVGTVKARLSRGRTALAAALGDDRADSTEAFGGSHA
jgi:RNA polymerase sigma factor (sigma-70 family)